MTDPSLSIDPMLRSQLKSFTTALKSFASSPSTFRITSSLPVRSQSSQPLLPPKTLYILDSSFNPPTLAHLRILTSALTEETPLPRRVLLLLATHNADKAPKPASFEQRLCMMTIFARELLNSLPTAPTPNEDIGVDIGVTKLPYFADKAKSIEESGIYEEDSQQVHLIGFDTLIRLLDTKYYPPSHTLEPLHPFLDKHRLRVAYRADDGWGGKEEQDGYLRGLGEGKREGERGKREWVTEGKIVLAEGRKEGEEVVSSTKVREAVKRGDKEMLGKLVAKGVGEWVMSEKLYLDESNLKEDETLIE